MKIEPGHLQYFAYTAAATRACHVLPQGPKRVIVDRNSNVLRWFNENSQVWRAMQKFVISTDLGVWPDIEPAQDEQEVGLQVADILTYYATKQFTDQRFSPAFDWLRPKSDFMWYDFDNQARAPCVPPVGVTVSPLPSSGGSASASPAASIRYSLVVQI
jgi:hypothetical protein